ncbi:MAG: phage major capsid protein [bacterium]|nr:phage major capsid protein [bacterium]
MKDLITRVKSGGPVLRTLELDRASLDEEARTVSVSISSEEPVDRWWGLEVLDHGPGSIRMKRLDRGLPILVDHNRSAQIGILEGARLDKDRRIRGIVRFSRSARAEQEMQDVKDGIRQNMSVSYQIHEMVLEKEVKDRPSTYRVTDWEPLEASFVAIPADMSVGVGRTAAGEQVGNGGPPAPEPGPQEKEKKMDKEKEIETREQEQPKSTPQPSVDVSSIREEARKAEHGRVQDIMAIAKMLGRHADGIEAAADEFIESGKGVEEFRAHVLKVISTKPVEKMPGHLGMSDREVNQYSLFRAIQASLEKDWSKAPFELEVSRALAEKMDKKPNGFLVPLDIPFGGEKRVLVAGTATTGAEMVGTDHLAANFIDALRQELYVVGLGAMILPGLVGNVEIPSMGDATFYHVTEDVNVTDSTPATSEVTLSPKTLGGAVPMSRRFLKQSQPAAEAVVRNLLVRGAAVEMEAKVINGSGAAGQPLGILGATGIGTVTITTPGQPTWSNLVDFETDVLTAKALKGNLAYLITPAVQGHCKTTAKVTGYPVFLMEGGEINGYKALATTNMPANGILFGNFRETIIGMWGGLDLKPDEATKAAAGGLVLRLFLDYDVGVGHGASFSKNA